MRFEWDPNKDVWLRANRGVSFQHVLYHIEQGDLLDVRKHPNEGKYPHQRILIVRIERYVYVIPFVKSGDRLFFKTIIPSRKETRRYLS